MPAVASVRAPRGGFIEFLARELAPTEGRAQAVLRIATACSVTVVIAMVFRIPLPTYMAYIVFLCSKDENSATVTTGVGALLAATLAVVLSLGLSQIDTAEPALRLPAMALVTFLAMYSVRTLALGPITYLAGFVLVMIQSLVDGFPSTEAFTRLTLWLWVVVMVPIAVTIVLNLLFGPASRVLVSRTMRRLLAELEIGLAAGISKEDLARWREIAVPLLTKVGGAATQGLTRPAISKSTVERLLEAFTVLEVLPVEVNGDTQLRLAKIVHACRDALDARPGDVSGPSLQPSDLTLHPDSDPPAIVALQDALVRLYESFHRAEPSPQEAAPVVHKQMLAPDAFSNPAHWQFALKTTLAVMVVYITYTLLNWPTLRTSIVTCFFVALGSLGETVNKLTLRISGAIIGGLIAGICIVWVLPHMTDIGQLCALIAVVSAGAGWIATSSERLSYGGMQMAFAFFLGVLQDYAPATDLTALRDRVVGILLGNVVMTAVFSVLWPESARTRLRTSLQEALRAIGALLQSPTNTATSRVRVQQALLQSEHYREISNFELQMLPDPVQGAQDESVLEGIRRIAGTAFVVTSDALVSVSNTALLSHFGDWAQRAAEALGLRHSLPPLSADDPAVIEAPVSEPQIINARLAAEQLRSEIQHVATTTT
jgi:multidrug resistance protein MdtO